MNADWPLPFWIAHRGAGKLAPENTLAAFRVGAAHGYRAFECDVKLSADGVPFLLHDSTLDRTTTASGVAGDRPWAELSLLDAGGWHTRAYAGEPLPSLDAIAAYVQRNGCALNVEIKPTPGREHATGVAVAAACARLWPGAAPALLLSSFEPDALRGARESAPALPRALLMDATVVALLHGAGLRALCYTVNDTEEARRLRALGVDGLITDAVDRFPPVDRPVTD